MTLVTKYWPAFVAGSYLVYILASGQTSLLGSAVAAFITSLGLAQKAASAHARLDSLK